MSNPNFVSDLVAMAKAFEELPEVKAELDAAKRAHAIDGETIQRLELRLIDLKTELDAAHANTRKVEVERDHAERMFLETDDRLNAFRRLLGSFQTEAGALIAAAEPQIEPTPEPTPMPEPTVAEGVSVAMDPIATTSTQEETTSPPLSATSTGAEPIEHASTQPSEPQAVSVQLDPTQATESSSENVSSGSGSQGLREVDPIAATATTDYVAAASEQPAPSTIDASLHSEVAAPVDPTASSTAGDGHSPETVTLGTDAVRSADVSTPEPATTPVDDVGYHNEPVIKSGDGGWIEWDRWCERMNLRYPRELGGWPPRNAPATA